jgi:DNA repair protein RecN (Recombination protein N)
LAGDARVIANLNISGLGVIATADLEFSAGLVAFTGETGAGKTMVVTAMGLVLGDRADTGVSAGSDRVDVDAVIVVPTDGPAAQQIEAAGGALDPDGSVVVTRSLSSQTRGRATLGGTAVPVAALHEFGERVAQRHSQSDQILLRKPRRQRISLDQYGGAAVAAAVRRYRERYDEFLTLTRRLDDLTADVGRRHARIAELREGLAEIEAVDPQVGEEQTLPDTILRLTNAESLRLAAGDALRWLSADDQEAVDAAVAMERGLTALQRVTGQDPGLVSVAERLGSAAEIVSEIAGELRRYTAVLHADPEALEQLHQRKAALAVLQRKYGDTGAEIRSWAEAAHAELAELDVDDDAVQALRAELTTVVTVLGQAAAGLSQARSAAATGLSAAVSGELRALSMPKAEFVVEVIQRDDPAGLRLPDGRACAFGENGVDVVRFLLAPHPGSVPSPIGDGASGGELSRIMLALEVVLAEHSPPSVFVFDEIDAGIGGRTATEVGRRLARLANRSQVFVVTHLAQVASFADQHIVVEKDQSGRVTAASVHEVAGDGRTTELSRMLSGQDQSPAARQHARELLDLAAADRSPEAG